MNVVSRLLYHNAPDERIALITSQGDFTYGDLRRGASAAARLLEESGVHRGDRVLLIDQSSFFWVSAYLGTIMAGCISVPQPADIMPGRFSKILESTDARFAFLGRSASVDDSSIPEGVLIFSGEGRSSGDVQVPDRLLAGGDRDHRPADVDPDTDLAALMFTSGSTGDPAGVMVTHGNILANTESIIETLFLTQDDRIMAVLPFYYCFGTSLLHTHLAVGGSLVVENRFLFPELTLNRMEETACTGIAGVPSTFQILLRKSTFRDRVFKSLRYVQQAGGKLPDSYIRELLQSLPGKQIFIMYGQTEATARLSCLDPRRLEDKLGSIGKGIPGVELEVLDQEGNPVAPGEVGEIVASGRNITAGYWKDPESTSSSFRHGKLYTGDQAVVDDEGFLFVVGRQKEFIKCAGHRKSSKEIEDVVLRKEGVVEAVALGMEDDKLGEAICLFVSHVNGKDGYEEVENFCRKSFSWPFTPRKVFVMDNLPKNISGKPDRVKLKAMLDEYRGGGS